MEMADRAKIFALNEDRLIAFLISGEPETTENYKFIEVHRPVNIEESEKKGQGLFLKDGAEPGQLLIVDNVIASCACIREYAPYLENSYVHAPKAAWKPPCPRIPPEVHDHLTCKLGLYIAKNEGHNYSQVLNLDSDELYGCENKSSSPDRKSSTLHKPEKSESGEIESPDDSKLQKLLWNIVGNNAVCNKVRSVNEDEPKLVETCEMWGVWQLSSYINHSCTPNCHRMRVGETMLIRAAKEIAAGGELTVPYFDIFEPLAIRDRNCQTFGFRCKCPRCIFERSLGGRYDTIETHVVQFKIKLQTMWAANPKVAGGREIETLLKNQAAWMMPITQLVEDIPHTKSTNSGSTSKRKLKNQSKTMTDNMIREMKQNWIGASFIDVHMAVYALCANLPSNCLEDIEELLCLPTKFGRHYIAQTEQEKCEERTTYAVSKTLNIIQTVHPGNMLAQEFNSIFFKTIRRFPKASGTASSVFKDMESFAVCIYSKYYGSGTANNPDILRGLCSLES